MDVRICFVGDSFVNGTGDAEFLGWTGRICRVAVEADHAVTLYNLGVRADTSADIAARWEGECIRRLLPEHDARIVFSFGANDATIENNSRRVAIQESKGHAEGILQRASLRFKTLFVGPPPVADEEHNERTAELDSLFQGISLECGVPYLSVLGSLRNSAAWMGEVVRGDGAHPGSKGYGKLAQLVLEWPEWWFHQP